MQSHTARTPQDLFFASMPAIFVFLWSTGFIGAKFGLPYAEPMTFLGIRFVLTAGLLMIIALALRAPWPRSRREIGHLLVAGVILHTTYLGAVFSAIDLGVEAGVTALIVGTQPILVAVIARPMLGERVRPVQWAGLFLGLAGVTLVIWNKLATGLGTPIGVGLCILALAAISFGTIYQKRYCSGIDLRTGNVIQFATAAVSSLALAAVLESGRVRWTPEFMFALGWLVGVLSLGAFSVFFLLIRRGEASRVSSLFFLVPPCTALLGWLLFDETFTPLALSGLAATALGVALVTLAR